MIKRIAKSLLVAFCVVVAILLNVEVLTEDPFIDVEMPYTILNVIKKEFVFTDKSAINIDVLVEAKLEDFKDKVRDESLSYFSETAQTDEYLFVSLKAENETNETVNVETYIYRLSDFTSLKMAEIGSERFFDLVRSEVVSEAKRTIDTDYIYGLEFLSAVNYEAVKEAEYYFNGDVIEVFYWAEVDENSTLINTFIDVEIFSDITPESEELLVKNYTPSHYVNPLRPMVAITFDDGPVRGNTDRAVDLLNQYDARGTFFMVGEYMERYPELIEKVYHDGHDIGSHSYGHPYLTDKKTDVAWEIGKTQEILQSVIPEADIEYVRPPYGSFNKSVREAVGLPLVMWSLDTLDWKTRDPEATLKAVSENVKDGDIILLHDLHVPSVDSLESVLPYLIENGYQIVSISELIEARGMEITKDSIIRNGYRKESAEE